MTKEDFIKKFPDIKVQQFETETILSKQEIMDIVEQATQSMDMGLVYYEHCGCDITVFTSDKMKAELAKMVPGYKVTDPNTGEVGFQVIRISPSDKLVVKKFNHHTKSWIKLSSFPKVCLRENFLSEKLCNRDTILID